MPSSDFFRESSSLRAGMEQSEFSTCLPNSISHDDVQSLHEGLDKSLESSSGLGNWEVQSKEDILAEVRQHVQAQKPWREELDDDIFEKRRTSERRERMDRGYLIILPDNRVRAMDTMLSKRVRAQLLDEQENTEMTSPSAWHRRPDENKPRGPRRFRNPWYLPPSSWYSNKAAKDDLEGQGGSFPYDSQILRGERATGTGAADEQDASGDGPHQLTQREKETLHVVEAYKQHMKGSRLPHFLQ